MDGDALSRFDHEQECKSCGDEVNTCDTEDGVCFGCLDHQHELSEKTYG